MDISRMGDTCDLFRFIPVAAGVPVFFSKSLETGACVALDMIETGPIFLVTTPHSMRQPVDPALTRACRVSEAFRLIDQGS